MLWSRGPPTSTCVLMLIPRMSNIGELHGSIVWNTRACACRVLGFVTNLSSLAGGLSSSVVFCVYVGHVCPISMAIFFILF